MKGGDGIKELLVCVFKYKANRNKMCHCQTTTEEK